MHRAPLSGWIFGAVCPERDTAEALVTTHVSIAPQGGLALQPRLRRPQHRHRRLLPSLQRSSRRNWPRPLHLLGELGKDQQITKVVLHLPR
jgi:hypothetical protein